MPDIQKSDKKGGLSEEELETNVEKAVVDFLLANHMQIATAESCTGGLLAGRLVDVPGVSDVFGEGYITYSNKAKEKNLGVKRLTLAKYGAVSAQTAEEMALGAARAARADVGVSVTGIAGPGGGTDEKPVGLVYIGCCVNGRACAEEYHFTGSRAEVRRQSVAAALELTWKCLLEGPQTD